MAALCACPLGSTPQPCSSQWRCAHAVPAVPAAPASPLGLSAALAAVVRLRATDGRSQIPLRMQDDPWGVSQAPVCVDLLRQNNVPSSYVVVGRLHCGGGIAGSASSACALGRLQDGSSRGGCFGLRLATRRWLTPAAACRPPRRAVPGAHHPALHAVGPHPRHHAAAERADRAGPAAGRAAGRRGVGGAGPQGLQQEGVQGVRLDARRVRAAAVDGQLPLPQPQPAHLAHLPGADRGRRPTREHARCAAAPRCAACCCHRRLAALHAAATRLAVGCPAGVDSCQATVT